MVRIEDELLQQAVEKEKIIEAKAKAKARAAAKAITNNPEEDYKKYTLTELRKAYGNLLKDYKKECQKNADTAYCHWCGEWLPKAKFYKSSTYASGLCPACKSCLFKIATNYNEKTKEVAETRQSIQSALKIMNKPFSNELYNSAIRAISDETSLSRRGNIWGQYVTMVNSLPQYQEQTWLDSDLEIFEEDGANELETKKITKRMKEFWGYEFSDRDLIFLDTQYKDWVTRHECNTKAQEEVFKRLCFIQLKLLNADKVGAQTKDLDRTFQELLDTANLKPKQNALDTLSDAQTLGTLIDKWENERPIPEVDDDLKDVDKIGLYLDVFFKGHLAKMLKLKNPLSRLYDSFIYKYTVTKPEYSEEEDTEGLFEQIFGMSDED